MARVSVGISGGNERNMPGCISPERKVRKPAIQRGLPSSFGRERAIPEMMLTAESHFELSVEDCRSTFRGTSRQCGCGPGIRLASEYQKPAVRNMYATYAE